MQYIIDLAIDCYSPGFHLTAFDVTISATLQPTTLLHAAGTSGYVANMAHSGKLHKYLSVCHAANLDFVPLAWETTGGAHAVVHSTLGNWLNMASDRSSIPKVVLRNGFYCQLSILLQQHNGRMVMNRLPSIGAPVWLFPGHQQLDVAVAGPVVV